MDEAEGDTLKTKVGEILNAGSPDDAVALVANNGIYAFFAVYADPDNNDPSINSIYVSTYAMCMILRARFSKFWNRRSCQSSHVLTKIFRFLVAMGVINLT